MARVMTRRQMLTVAYFVAGLATSFVGFVDSAFAMSALSALAGLAAACVNPLLVIFISELYPAGKQLCEGKEGKGAGVQGEERSNGAATSCDRELIVSKLTVWQAVL